MKLHPLFNETDYPTDALIARVAAGEPLEIGDEFEQVDLNYLMTRGNPHCVLVRVSGVSMFNIDERHSICHGDWLMIDRQREAVPGNIVLARVGLGFTVKRFEFDDRVRRNGLHLVPANKIYETRHLAENDHVNLLLIHTARSV